MFSGSRPVLWGITSFGATTCNDGVPVFARVAAFTTFLEPALDEIAPAPAPVPAPAPAPTPARAPAPAPVPARPSAPSTPARDQIALPRHRRQAHEPLDAAARALDDAPGAYRLKITAADAAGNSRSWLAAVTARRAR